MRIFLRPITIDDGLSIVKWRNSPRVLNHCFDKKPITIESNREFYDSCIKTGKYIQFIVERIDEDFGISSYPIATVYLKDLDTINKRCELCVFTSDDQEWNTESQKIAVNQLLYKAFNEYNMNKVYTYVFFENKDEVDLMISVGFKEEAVLREEAVDERCKYVDVIRMAILKRHYDMIIAEE